MTVHELSRVEARRIAVRAQLLAKPRPTDLHDVVRGLTLLQYDQTAAVAPSADLVLWSRIGPAYKTSDLAAAIEERSLIEVRGMLRPAEDVPLYRAEMAAFARGEALLGWEEPQRAWIQANDQARREVLARLDTAGPLPLSELPTATKVRWRSSGWNNNRDMTILLELMAKAGEVAIAGRDGRERLWDLPERVYPPGVIPAAEARQIRDERWLHSLGIARARRSQSAIETADVGDVGEKAVVEGLRGTWRVDPAQLGRPFNGRTALLSPLDRLIFDRKRMLDLFDFDYNLEMYKPASKRRWGYWALPILSGDGLVGKLDATADRKAGVLRVDRIHEDVPFSPAMMAALNREIRDLARWLGLPLNL